MVAPINSTKVSQSPPFPRPLLPLANGSAAPHDGSIMVPVNE
jgi:hypothetical protein